MAAIDLTGWQITGTLTAETGCDYAGTFTVTSVDHAVNMGPNPSTVTLSLKSDGAVTTTWDETAGSGPTDILGENGSFADAGNSFNLNADGWSGTINCTTADYVTFDSQWEKSKPKTFSMTATVTGVLQFDASNTGPLPTS